MPNKCSARHPKMVLMSCHGPPDTTNQYYCLLEGDGFGKRCSDKRQEYCYQPEGE